MTRRRAALDCAVILTLATLAQTSAQTPATRPAEPASQPSEALVARLTPEWTPLVSALLTLSEAQQRQLLGLSDEVLRLTLARQLARFSRADEFLRNQLKADPSPRVRSTIAQVIAADARWLAFPDTVPLLERVVASDADAGVSVTALEALRRLRLRG